ncbi:MAG TPA: hypothetical protein VF808_15955 [Ktedonobacterales bacterium]
MSQATFRASPMEQGSGGSAPLITLFERDDAIAVPLLSQLRMAGYDVRAARTPVELFDILSKSLVALVLVDLGAATAGRREFWVALDAQRRGRAIQVMTFRFIPPHGDLDLDLDPAARAIPDVEAHGAHEFHRIIDGVRQRVPLHSAPATQQAYPGAGMAPGAAYASNAGIQPLGAALGMAPTPFSAQNGHLFNAPGAMPAAAPAGWGGIAPLGVSPVAGGVFDQASAGMFPPSQPLASQGGPFGGYGVMGPSPFEANSPGGQFGASGIRPYGSPPVSTPLGGGASPFAQPYQANPFSGQTPVSQPPTPPMPAPPVAPISQPQPWQPQAWQAHNLSPAAPSSYPSNYPPGFPPSFPPSSPSSVPPWPSAGSFPQSPSPARPDSGPTTFGGYGGYDASSPGYGGPAAQSTVSAPGFQDAWSPPDAEIDLPTGIVPEIAFQRAAPRASAWEDSSRPLLPPMPDVYIAPRSQLGPDPAPAAPSRALVSTPTETALGGVLVDGALLTAGRLEALKGIQSMLANVNIHRKLGDLALLFKFLSSDQLLAAILVSRGLVSPQQIASLGKVKQEMAASGVDNDLETLLVTFKVLPADQLRKIRAELGA